MSEEIQQPHRSSKHASKASSVLDRLYWVPLAAACFYGVYFALQVFDCRFAVGDEGVATMGAWRILQGQVPHRDFFEILPPFSFVPTAFTFATLGVNLLSERILVLIYTIALAFGTERLLASYTSDIAARTMVVAYLTPFGVLSWPLASHHWVLAITVILTLLALLRAQEHDRNVYSFIAGVFTSVGVFSTHDQGAYLVVALAVMFFPAIDDRVKRRRRFRSWVLGGLMATSVFALWLLPHVSFGELWYQLVAFPAAHYKDLPGNRGHLVTDLLQIASSDWLRIMRQNPSYHLGLTGLTLFTAMLPVLTVPVLVVAARGKWASLERVGLLAAGSLACLGVLLHRYALTNHIWAAPVPLVVVGWWVARLRSHSAGSWKRWAGLAIVILVTGCSVAYSWSILKLTSSDAVMVDVRGRAGTLRTVKGSSEAALQNVLDLVERHVPPGDPLFCTGFNGLINFWTQRPNPTRFNSFNLSTDEQSMEVIEALEREPRSYILVSLPVLTRNAVIDHALQNYERVGAVPSAMLMRVSE